MSDQEPPLLCPAGFPVPPGTREWTVGKGEKGEKGPKGDRGEQGMPRGQRQAVVALVILTLLLAGANLLWTGHEVQAHQRRWCATIGTLLSQQPPPGRASSNPSRAYEQQLYADFTDLRRQFGCG